MRIQLWKLAIAFGLALFWNASKQECWAQQPKKPTLVEGQLFHPTGSKVGDWEPKNLPYQDVEFEASDGTALHGWYCKSKKQGAVVLFSHGNAGNVALRAVFLNALVKRANVSVFLYDYRGYGKSRGVPTIEGVSQDARAARAKLCKLSSINDNEMILMGESLGGAISVQLASESAPRALVLQSTFSSLRDCADQLYPQVAFLVGQDLLNSRKRIVDYHGPLFQSHGDADRTISIRLGRKLFHAANEPKAFFEVTNAGHNDLLTDEYLTKLSEFIDHL